MILIIILTILSLLLIIGCYIFVNTTNKYRKQITYLQGQNSEKRSAEVTRGFMSEQLAPFLESFPGDAHKLRFIGQPIDYISFDENEIVFYEIKSGNAKLSDKQRNIKYLIDNKKVRFATFRIKANNENKENTINDNKSANELVGGQLHYRVQR